MMKDLLDYAGKMTVKKTLMAIGSQGKNWRQITIPKCQDVPHSKSSEIVKILHE
jgi:hypothetical protein